MSNIDKQALRKAAENATPGKWRMASTRFNGIARGKFSLTNNDAHRAIYAYPEAEVDAASAAAGIGKGE